MGKFTKKGDRYIRKLLVVGMTSRAVMAKRSPHQRFLTTTTMMNEFGQPRNALLLKLKATGVMPFRPNGENFGQLYLRRDIEAMLS
ncbi:hypothetical protein OSB_24980 [Octadecabacter temperatus]|uniref:Uncharacterized protein n=1 Tax=Octadecabacter temperatus TaxID=1458307 RepID=A0A0K0Y816_9RHOB|nr:hypothetical protein OSB_24980 [Octadecabacter temperatus]